MSLVQFSLGLSLATRIAPFAQVGTRFRRRRRRHERLRAARTAMLAAIPFFLVVSSATSQVPTLVADINQDGVDATVNFFGSNLRTFDTGVLFTVRDDNGSNPLWASEGSSSVTGVVTDTLSMSITAAIPFAGDFMLFGTDGGPECSIWKYNVVSPPSVLATPSGADWTGGCGERVAAISNFAFFTLETASNGQELWQTDGTALGTVMLDIAPGPQSSFPRDLQAVGDRLFFTADDGTNGRELWWVEPSRGAGGTQLVRADSIDGSEDFMDVEEFVWHPTLQLVVMAAETTAEGTELATLDTVTGALTVYPIANGVASSSPRNLTVLGQRVVFAAEQGSTGEEPWVFDGTQVSILENINPTGGSEPGPIAATPSRACFLAEDATDVDIWCTDGLTATKVMDLTGYLGTQECGNQAHASANQVWLWLENSLSECELWATNGTAVDTQLQHTFSNSPLSSGNYQAVANDDYYFIVDEGTGSGQELWLSRDSLGATFELTDVQSPGSSPLLSWFEALPSSRSADPGDLVFTANDGQVGEELWRTTSGTAELLDDTVVGVLGGRPCVYGQLGSKLVVSYDDPSVGRELFTLFDGTLSLIADTLPGIDSGHPFRCGQAHVSNDRLVWGGNHPSAFGRELFVGASGDHINTNTTGSDSPSGFTSFGAFVYFAAVDTAGGRELFRTDGTAAGTGLFVDLNPAGGSSPDEFLQVGSHLYFSASDAQGDELWRTDGTSVGTERVTDFDNGPLSLRPSKLVASGGYLYFVGQLAGGGQAIYSFDLATDALTAVHTLSLSFDELAAVDGGVVFGDVDPALGWELFVAGPTSSQLLLDIAPGPFSSIPLELTEYQGHVLFAATSLVNGRELWVTDGTHSGTKQAVDVLPGPKSSGPNSLAATATCLYFAATDGTTGTELHCYNMEIFVDGFNGGDTDAWSSTTP